ncbi:MAG: hypothetical protein IKE52_04765 [Mogibacterium sp.]|nr:hypothetical protein [Mogibacterium sp.]
MEKKRTKLKLMILTILLLVIFAGTAAFSGIRAYRDRYANEKFDEIDIFSMHEFSRVNSEKALQALKDGNRESLEGIMVSSAGLEGVMNFAEWGELDIENAVSMGSGSLSAKANDKGMIDVSERFIAEAGGTKYVLFIETLTSRWGRKNEGISAIGVTSFEHFNDIDYNWNGIADKSSALAGELFWQGNQ